jgi:hypothetical protein
MLLSLVNGGDGNLILEALDVSENYSWVNSGVFYCPSTISYDNLLEDHSE